jgi:chaperone BCS1
VKHIEKARQEWISSNTWMQTVYSNKEGEWIGMPSHNSKAMSTVVLSGNTSREIEEDLESFLESEEWYKEMGIAFTRGYLLHGRPGTGKTSIIKAMSYKLKMDIYNFNLAVVEDDDQLKTLFDKVPVRSMVVLEDIDCMSNIAHARMSSSSLSSKEARSELPKLKIGPTLSCLLNALDGITPPHGRVLVMTTNHPEKLDAALTRPGRIDMIVALEMCSPDIVIKLYKLYYKKSLDDETVSILADADCQRLSPADVSSIFLKQRHDSKLGIQEVLDRIVKPEK